MTPNNVLLQAQKKRRESMENPMATVACHLKKIINKIDQQTKGEQ
jgi:hypothetical protein